MNDENKPERLPPYISYKTWNKLIQGLVNFLPGAIDNSVLSQMKFSGTDVKRLRTALRFLDLVGDNCEVKPKLVKLVKAYKGEEGDKKEVLREIINQSYPLCSDTTFNLATATWKQLNDRFDSMGTKSTIQKLAISFFLHLCAEAELELSPHLTSKSGYGRPNVVRKARQKQRQVKITSETDEEKIEDKLTEPNKPLTIKDGLDINQSVAGVLYLLPKKEQTKWDKASKERFKIALSAILDAVYPDEEQNTQL